MTKMSSTMLSVGTLLRRAEDTGAEVSVLVQGAGCDGRVIGCDGLGAVLDDGDAQSLVRLDSVAAVQLPRAQMERRRPRRDARSHRAAGRGPIEAGPVTVPTPVEQASAHGPQRKAVLTTSRASSCTWARWSGPRKDSA